jgi:hypothetical protein
LKPACGSGGEGIVVAESPAELAALALSGDYQVERLLPGRHFGSVVFFDRGRPAAWFSFSKEEVWPGRFSPTCSRRLAEHPAVEDILGRIGAALGLTALCGLDWIIPDGGSGPVILELNGRPIPGIDMAAGAGVDFSAAFRDMLAGRQATRRPLPAGDGRLYHLFPRKIQQLGSRGDALGLLRVLLGRDGTLICPWDDPGLLWPMLAPLAAAGVRRARRKAGFPSAGQGA